MLNVMPTIKKDDKNGIKLHEPFSGVSPRLKKVKGIKVKNETMHRLRITIYFLSYCLIILGVIKKAK